MGWRGRLARTIANAMAAPERWTVTRSCWLFGSIQSYWAVAFEASAVLEIALIVSDQAIVIWSATAPQTMAQETTRQFEMTPSIRGTTCRVLFVSGRTAR